MRARRLLVSLRLGGVPARDPLRGVCFLDITAFHSRIAMDALGISRGCGPPLLMLRPTLGVVVIDERGVRVRTLFKSAFIPWQDVRQVGKHDGLVAIPKSPAPNIFISRVRQPWAEDKHLPRLYRCFWRRKGGGYTRNVLNFRSSPALEAAIRHYWPGEWVYLLPESWFPARGEPQKIVVHKMEMSARDLPVRSAKERPSRG